MVGAESSAGRGPGQAAQVAVPDHLPDAAVVRAQHLAGGGDQLHSLLLRAGDQVVRLGHSCGHGLIEVAMLVGVDGGASLLVVEADGSGDGQRVELPLSQQVLVAVERLGDAEAFGGGASAAGDGVADGGDAEAVLHVRHRAVRQDTAQRNAAGAQDGEAERFWH